MPLSLVLLQGTGPLPLVGSFKFESTLEANIVVSGSAWSNTTDSQISVAVNIDGTDMAGAQVFANEADSHKALVSALTPVNLAFGDHTVALRVLSDNTQTDQNDFFTVTLIY